jgi:MYXO-CTERM domain-containing protein
MMPRLVRPILLAAATLSVPAITAGVARAHIEMDFPTARTLMQKKPHCGEPTIPRGTPHVFAPGATITLRWHETVNHPGHYRVSFNPNGDTFGLPPTATDTTLGIDPLVLVDLIPDAASGAGTYSQDITLPNMECTNCTIQVIQLMTDKLPYSINYPDPAANDIYFQCIDVVLSASAPDANPGGGTPDAGGGGNANPDAGIGGGETGGTTGGCAAGGEPAGLLLGLGLVGAAVARRRRSRSR